jgi:mucin-19
MYCIQFLTSKTQIFTCHWLCRLLFSVIALFAPTWLWAQTCSIPAQGAAATIATAPNTYFPSTTANLAAGSTQIPLGAGRGVNASINPGDLLLIIQMQDATINANDTNQYGDGVGSGINENNTGNPARGSTANTAGTYEFAVATNSVVFAGLSTVNLSAPLQNAYVSATANGTQGARTYQVIRVPQYTSLTLNGTITPPEWNGSTGGVLILDVAGQLNFNGQTINASQRGFRGGGGYVQGVLCATNAGRSPCTDYRALNAATANGAFKGEGIAGTPAYVYSNVIATVTGSITGTLAVPNGYPNGDRGRGAPGNAGGGGNQHNSGGGGGGNGGIGGFGGNTWNNNEAAYAGERYGGIGGANGYNSGTRIILGGGGGAGDVGGNGGVPPNLAHGGSGGGIVMIRASSVIGTGTINANGAPGIPGPLTDAGGGGGAGGSVWISTSTGILPGSLSITANGGAGGDTGPMAGRTEIDGPGGGGGGGTFLTNSTGAAFTANGGAAGTVNNSSNSLCGTTSGNTQCFATAGIAGNTTLVSVPVNNTGVRPASECLPDVRVTKATSTPLISASGATTAAYTISLQNFGGGARNVNVFDNALPPGWTLAAAPLYTYFPAGPIAANNLPSGAEASNTAGGATFPLAAAPLGSPSVGSGTLTWQQFFLAPLKAGVPSQITISMIVNIPASAPVGCYHNGAGYSMLDPTFLATAANRTVTSATNNAANRTAQAYSPNTTYASGATTTIAGSNYSGLPNGPAAEDICLQADLSVSKSVSPTGTIAAGQTVLYTLTPRNNGRAIGDTSFSVDQTTTATQSVTASAILASSNLRITDTLPFGATVVTAFSGAGWACSTAGTSVGCSRTPTSVQLAATTDLSAITGTVRFTTASCPGPMTNTVQISSLQSPYTESSLSNNASSAASPLNCNANLSVTKTNTVTSLVAGSTTSYLISFSNAGPSSAENAVVRDVPSSGLSCSIANCVAAGGSPTATCPAPANLPNMLTGSGLSLPSFPAGSTLNFIVNCNVTASGS